MKIKIAVAQVLRSSEAIFPAWNLSSAYAAYAARIRTPVEMETIVFLAWYDMFESLLALCNEQHT
jgi:hypothetical protein